MKEGGLAHLTISWACRDGDGEYEPPQRWIEATGCDARLVCVEFRDALGHAAMWNRNVTGDHDRHLEDFNRWAAYFEREGIQGVGTAGLILRRRKGSNWIRTHEVKGYTGPRAGSQLERLLEAEDRTERWSPGGTRNPSWWIVGEGASGVDAHPHQRRLLRAAVLRSTRHRN